jgi:hypothetical protein
MGFVSRVMNFSSGGSYFLPVTGSFLFAFLIHTPMAMSNEIFAVYNSPEFSFKQKEEEI